MDVSVWWRLVNALIAVTALTWLLVDFHRIHHTLSKRRVYLTFSLAGLLAGVVVASIEAVVQSNPLGVRTAVNTAACLWCLFGLKVSTKQP